MTNGYADADTHLYEPRDAFSRFMPAEARHLAVRVVPGADGESIMVGDTPLTFLSPLYDRVPVPGSLREVLCNLKIGDIDDDRLTQPVRPEYVEPNARLAWMDDHRVDMAIVVPSLGGVVETYMDHDAEQTSLNLHAFNRWLEADWGFTRGDRLFTTPMVSLLDPALALAEIRWLADRGARVIHLRPGPAGRRSPADPAFDGFWEIVNTERIRVALHISESGYNRSASARWSEDPHPSAWNISAFQWTTSYGDRPIMDTVAALVLHNLFGRFPDVQVLSLENGSLWVPYLSAAMDKMKGMGRNSPWIGGRLADRPSDVLRGHLSVSPFHEEDHQPLVDTLGADRVVFGSDFPHPEGVARPEDYLESVAQFDDAVVRRIMHDNLRALLT